MSEVKVFDATAATELVKELRGTFASGRTRSYEWRVSQLESILKLSADHEEEISDAIHSDLSKPALESIIHEIGMVKNSCKLALKELRRWMTPEKVQTTITTFPSSAEIVPEPLGVVLIISPWNYPFCNGRVGRIVMAAAAKHLTPVVLELGGKSPVVVDSKINLQVACRRIIAGKWGGNNGQACVSPDYIITTKEVAPKLVESLKQELERFYGKNPLESKDLSRIVNANHFDRLTKLLDDDKVSGKIVLGGEKDKSKLQIAPTLLLDVPRDSLIMTEEIFGPLLPIITVDKLEDCFEIVNSVPKPLAAYLFTSNKKLKEQFVACISAGAVVINDTTLHLAVSTLPFGGVGESGMGAYHGKFSFDAFSHKKAVLYRSFAGDVAMRYPPYTPGKLRFLKALLGGGILGLIRALLGWS
ncbi:aldehyde dehydrogenase family 3 member H1-like isoform X2 [Cucurbita moschata]|uniref:Aldehyde dehydrogenase n=1 Tax=Cucurbita moschata TaxID=3662 RepID=A0A6J1FCS8_CUCMO|nr:aldehyde dehydrogenase family 3 member H1-like isoform X2 [Cucurbita moschata]